MRPIRVLQVVGGMDRAGTETWLMHVLRNIDRDRYRMDFLVHTLQPRAYDDEIRALGAKVIPCLHPSRPLRYAKNLKRILREYGPYDVIHSHVRHFSGYIARIARQAGIPCITHSHSDTSSIDDEAHVLRKLYLRVTSRWIAKHSSLGLAASTQAATSLFGPLWRDDPRWRVLHCGIDLDPFNEEVDSTTVRAELGIPQGALVIGHVGRFCEPKNHDFLVEVAAQVAVRSPNTCLLLIGKGPLRPAIEQKVCSLGLTTKTIFAGVRSDVARLMLGAMDVFVVPSHYEGLGLVIVEAQAAALPCVISDTIPEEADVVKSLVTRMSLDRTAGDWAEAVLRTIQAAGHGFADACALIRSSPFNVRQGVKLLEDCYTQLSCTHIPNGARPVRSSALYG